jgi:uncharacterized protein YndB with AHSA1/START domain
VSGAERGGTGGPSPPAEDREIVTTRILDAPREIVFRAWTEPEHLLRWYGPKGFTSTFDEFDARPGGVWRFVLHGPDGGHFRNEIVFEEIVPPERIASRRRTAPFFRTLLTLEDWGNRTALVWRMLFDTVRERDNVRRFAAETNEQNLDRLEAELARMMGEAGG